MNISLFHVARFVILWTAIWMGLSGFQAIAQEAPARADMSQQWQHADAAQDGMIGTSAARAYSELLAGRTPQPVVVAIIDSGTEVSHPDLDGNIWVNTDEIAGNGVDDDRNGYVDDIHGWSFISGPGGDVVHDNLEFTRLYAALYKLFNGKTEEQVSKSERADFRRYISMKADYENRLAEAEQQREEYNQIVQFHALADGLIKTKLGKDEYSLEDLALITPEDDLMNASLDFMRAVFEDDLMAQLEDYRQHIESQFEYSYNLDFNPRPMVGDRYEDTRERIYGTPRMHGPKAEHGTHVAGIVGAERNDFGMDGICPSCQLMILRCVPDGDERDKDVANSIRYAVDNGARIINMSFGKSYSPHKDVVDEAVRYAESKGVLIIHAAGNEGKNVDKKDNFPNARYEKGGRCKTWIEVGASTASAQQLAADFSNYGKKSVDIFAPGVAVYSTMTEASYKLESGTSMASPVVAGVAGALLAYFPELSAAEIRKILLASGTDFSKQKVTLPGSTEEVTFGTLSRTGRVINLYEAVKLAQEKAGK